MSDTSRQAAESLTELRSAAITDISSSTTRASAVAEEAVRDACAVDERIAALQEVSESITEMVRLISAISQQSRFLALNAYAEAARAVRLAELLLGGGVLAWDDDPRPRSPLVDEVVAPVGGTCTLFQRLDDAGGMVRVATTVVNAQGRRTVS